VRPAKARALVDYLQGVFLVSIRRACDVLLFQKSSYFYKPRRPSQAVLRQCIREIAETHVCGTDMVGATAGLHGHHAGIQIRQKRQ